MASWGWAAAAGAAVIGLASSGAAATPAAPDRAGWSQRIDRDLAQDNAADLAVALRQL